MSRVNRVKVAFTALILLVVAGISHARAESVERALAVPSAAYAGATLFGLPVSEITQWVMLLYTVALLVWHIKTKWLANKDEVAG